MARTQIFNPNQNNGTQERMGANVNTHRQTSILGSVEKRGTADTINVLCLDTSSSTEEPTGRGDNRPKIQAIKEASTTFVAGLPDTARLSLITFDSQANIICPMTHISGNKLAIIQKIQGLNPNGWTAMYEAMSLGEGEFKQITQAGRKRLLVLTDGMPNSDPSALADSMKNQGIQITTIGFGEAGNIDESLLQNMASTGARGVLYYHFADRQNLTSFMSRTSKVF